MATPFEFPLSYIESMLPRAATATETVTAPMLEEPNGAAALQDLLSSLENQSVPQPQQPKQWQRIIGALGDALGAYSAVRAGGQAPAMGPFAANLRQRQMDYEQQAREAAQAGVETRNKVRIGAFEESQRLKREKEVAGMRMQNTRGSQGYLTDPETGERRLVNIVRDRAGNLVDIQDIGESNVAPFIQPAVPGESGPIRIPRAGPPGPVGKTPPPPEEAGQRAGNLASFSQGIARLKELLPRFIESKGGGQRLGQQVLRQAPMIGPQISERISKEGEQVAAVLQRVRADFVRIMSGLQASEMEQKRLAGILPDLGTVDAETALSKIEEFEAGVRAYAREKYRQRPGLFSPELIQELGLEGSGGGPYSGKVLHERDFSNAAPGERERFIAGGGTVEP